MRSVVEQEAIEPGTPLAGGLPRATPMCNWGVVAEGGPPVTLTFEGEDYELWADEFASVPEGDDHALIALFKKCFQRFVIRVQSQAETSFGKGRYMLRSEPPLLDRNPPTYGRIRVWHITEGEARSRGRLQPPKPRKARKRG